MAPQLRIYETGGPMKTTGGTEMKLSEAIKEAYFNLGLDASIWKIRAYVFREFLIRPDIKLIQRVRTTITPNK